MKQEPIGNTELLQVKLTKRQKAALQKYAKEQGVTLAELTRQQLRPLIAQIVAGEEVAA